ncbi:hypothetical protein Tco_1112860 [Tanacetum coccineum]|uniref:Uncharacterized protein n=1 Tax=Tanacetum coccineum TaxID=301880 RepID=A0ABQ5ISW2_9ASTR
MNSVEVFKPCVLDSLVSWLFLSPSLFHRFSEEVVIFCLRVRSLLCFYFDSFDIPSDLLSGAYGCILERDVTTSDDDELVVLDFEDDIENGVECLIWLSKKKMILVCSDLDGGSMQLLRETLAGSSPTLSDVDDEDLDLGERNIKKCKRKIFDGHYTASVRVLFSTGVALYSDATLEDLQTKHPFHHTPSLSHIPINHHLLIASLTMVLDKIKSFPRGTSCGRDGFRAQHLMDCLIGATVDVSDDAPLKPLVKPGGCIHPIVADGLQLGVGVSGGSKAIVHAVNRLIEGYGDDVGLSMLLVDFKNAFNLLDCITGNTRYGRAKGATGLSLQSWYLDDGTIVGDTLVVGEVLKLIMEDGPRRGLHFNVDKTEVICPKEDPRSRLTCVFTPDIVRPLRGVKLLGGPASVGFDFCNDLVMKRVAKTIVLMDVVAKINDPQCELLLLRSCTGISRLYFTMRTCPSRFFESAQRSFDVALRSSLERIVTASGPGFGDWQWRLATLPFAFGGLGVYSTSDVLNYAFLALRFGLRTKLFRHTGIIAFGPIFDDALCEFNTSKDTSLFSNSSEIAALKLMKKMATIYFTWVTKNAESTFSLSPRKMALWKSQRENHTSDWLRTVPISGLGQTMNGIFMETMLYRVLGFQLVRKLISGWMGCDKPLHPADMLLYSWDGGLDVCVDLTGSSPLTQTGMADFVPGRAVIDVAQRKRVKYMAKCAAIGYGFLPFSFSSFGELEDEAVTLLKRIRKFFMTQDIWARAAAHIFNRINFAIAKGEVDIGLDGERDKPLRPADMSLYSWDGGLDVCVDLTGSSPLTQTGMVDFVPGRAVIDAAQRKHGKYMDRCAAIGYGFLPFSFSSLGELEADAVTLLKRIQKFYITQDIGARTAIHIFNRISFVIAKGVGAQIVSRLPSNFL